VADQTPVLTIENKALLAEFKKRKEVYEKAREQLRETTAMVQAELHEAHPLNSLVRAGRDLDLLISGCDARILRMETIGR
jgi:hypothetical protein